jgi:hypothetical protein
MAVSQKAILTSPRKFQGLRALLCTAALALTACAGGGSDASSSTGTTSPLPGTMYYIFAGELNKLELGSGKKTKLINQGAFDDVAFDVSVDGKELIYIKDAPSSDGGDYYDQEYFNLVDAGNFNQVNSRFKKVGSTDKRTIDTKLSGEKTKIAALWSYYDRTISKYTTGVYIWERTGKEINFFTKDNSGNAVRQMAWLPDGNLLMTTNLGIVKTTDTTLKNFELLFKPNLPSWGSVAVSPDGTRLALKSGRHIYTMNIDGSNLMQVTDSDDDGQEYSPTWSPDGKYLAFTADKFVYSTGVFVDSAGTIYQMLVAPADNKTYKISKQASEYVGNGGLTGTENITGSNGVILIKSTGKSSVFAEQGFVWR